jgi:hypothetical protein
VDAPLRRLPAVTPDPVDDPVFGRLVWVPSVHWYEGTVRLLTGEPVEIHLSPFDSLHQPYPDVLDDPHGFFGRCADFCRLIVPRLDEYKGYVADDLLAIHNSNWREYTQDGRDVVTPVIDRATFVSRLVPHSISVSDPSGGEVWFEDGGLFWGHDLRVDLDERGDPTDCGM